MRSLHPLHVSFLVAALAGACTDPPKPAKASKEDLAKMTWPFMEGLAFEGLRASGINAAYDELTGEADG